MMQAASALWQQTCARPAAHTSECRQQQQRKQQQTQQQQQQQRSMAPWRMLTILGSQEEQGGPPKLVCQLRACQLPAVASHSTRELLPRAEALPPCSRLQLLLPWWLPQMLLLLLWLLLLMLMLTLPAADP